MIEIKQDFTQRELLWFGPLFALFIGLVDVILVNRFQATMAAKGLAVLAAVLIVVYYAAPKLRKPIYVGWLMSVAPLGWIMGHVILTVIYFALITPIAVALRATGHDPLNRRANSEATSYWTTRAKPRPTDDYFRQY